MLTNGALHAFNKHLETQNGQSRETDNAGHTRQKKTKKTQHNVRWTPLSASKHK
jgi:hypothetical protein